MSLETGGATRELDTLSLAALSKAAGRWMLAARASTPRGHPAQPAAGG